MPFIWPLLKMRKTREHGILVSHMCVDLYCSSKSNKKVANHINVPISAVRAIMKKMKTS